MADFIEQIATYVKQYAPHYGITVYSPIIAQAVLESAMGKSELAVNAHNYFGLKYKSSVAAESYIKTGSEQNSDGTYTSSLMMWCKFPTMASGVKGYFEFISASRYANLKGVTDPEQYLNNIKADGYATSLNYVSSLMNVIKKYDLTKYDPKDERKNGKMKINIHAGHNPDGKIACGAVGYIKESTEARLVKDLVICKLENLGHTVYDCTCNDGKSVSDVLQKIVKKCNVNAVDLDISIHFNAGSSDPNSATTGTEVLVLKKDAKSMPFAMNTARAISSLGFKDRGVKIRPDLYFLKHTKSPAMLIECCFVDDKDDVALYNADKMANAIVKGITGSDVKDVPTTPSNTPVMANIKPYLVSVNTDSLNVRAGAGVTYAINTSVLKGQVLTIVEEKNGWGRLKTGEGWVNLKYTKKV